MFTLNKMACLENSQGITYALKPLLREIQPLLPHFRKLHVKAVPPCMCLHACLRSRRTTPTDGGALREKEAELRCLSIKLQSTKYHLALQGMKRAVTTDLLLN